MKNKIVLMALMIFACSVSATFAQSKQEEITNFISNAKLLEKMPFDKAAPAVRVEAFKWVVETDAVSVQLCSPILAMIPEKKNKFKTELTQQLIFGMAVFKLENPDRKGDETAAILAGLESALRAYETMLAENPKARNAELDKLLVERDAGKLAETAARAKC